MVKTTIYLLGGATASSWWAASIWGHSEDHDSALPLLWALAVVLTGLTMALAWIFWYDYEK